MKAIRWQVPFVSIGGTNYRVDIYDEGYVGNPVQLLAGDTPFTTDEDSSDDYFCPIRTQSGTLQVCTDIPEQTDYPNGGTLNLEDLLPSNNIERPVRLINVDADKIEWQGFLSCEAYSQQYTAIPQFVSFPVISVLEAMDSVRISTKRVKGINLIRRHIYMAIIEIDQQIGMTPLFTDIFYSRASWNIWIKQIDASSLYSMKEYSNENSITYIEDGMSCKDVLIAICTYMGWTCREQGTAIYFQRLGEENSMYHITPVYHFGYTGFYQKQEIIQLVTGNIDDFDWMGDNHKRSIKQGARSVEVIAKLKKYDIHLSLPEFPFGEISAFYKKYNIDNSWLYIVANLDEQAYSNLFFKYYKGTINIPGNIQQYDGETNLEDVLSRMIAGSNNTIDEINMGTASQPPYRAVVAAGAFLSQTAYENQDQTTHSPTDGLYCVWMPQVWDTDSHYDPSTGYYYNTDVFTNLDYIFKMSTPLPVTMIGGFIRLNASMTHIIYQYENYSDFGKFYKKTDDWNDKLYMHIRVGDKYWNGSAWTTAVSKIWVNTEGTNFKNNWSPSMGIEETDGFLIPISNILQGEVEIALYCPIKAEDHSFMFLAETFFSRLDLDYIIDDSLLTDRSENHYFRLLDTYFRDDISVSAEFASNTNNKPSPSIILEPDESYTPLTTLPYVMQGDVIERRRPEIDLLNRMADFYSAARQTVELEVAHPATPLPLLKLNGIGDGKQYIPLAESRDWIMEKSTLTCIEVPSEPPAES